jgi:arylsulfatase A-like enzyme
VRTREAYAARYDAEIRQLDRQIARLVSGLDALGRPPLVIATADHGEALGEDGFYFAHGHSVGLDQIRVPLLVRPAVPRAPATVVQAVSLVDVAPTLLAAAGLPPPEGGEGRVLPGALADAAAADAAGGAPRALFAEHGRQVAVVRGDRYLARDREPGHALAPDGRPWGRKAPALPERSAALPADPRATLPPYGDSAADRAALEPLLEAFLGATPAPAAERAEVPAESEVRLRALGYAE